MIAAIGLMGATVTLAVIALVGPPALGSAGQILGLLGSSGIIWVTARRHRHEYPLRARGWMFIALGLIVLATAVLPFLFSSVARPAYSVVELAGIPAILIGFGFLRRSLRSDRRERRLAALDGTLAGVGGAVLTWMVVFEPFVGRHALSSVVAVGVFPLVGMLALSYWILPLLLLDRRNPIARSLVAASLLIVTVGLTSAVATLGSDLDIRRLHGWYGVVVTIGALAVAGPRCWQDDELTMNDAFLDRERIALITASLATIPAVLLGAWLFGATPNLVVAGVGAAVMVSLVAVRLSGALRETDRLQSRLRHLAEVDPLTDLPNRRATESRLELIDESGEEVTVLFIDLDGFKGVNDRRGHGVGDLLLREVAGRLSDCVRSGDLLARFGGDEFVLLAPGLSAEQAELVARRIQRTLTRPYELDGEAEQVGASVGIASGGGTEGPRAHEVLGLADQAMYEAKVAAKRRAAPASRTRLERSRL